MLTSFVTISINQIKSTISKCSQVQIMFSISNEFLEESKPNNIWLRITHCDSRYLNYVILNVVTKRNNRTNCWSLYVFKSNNKYRQDTTFRSLAWMLILKMLRGLRCFPELKRQINWPLCSKIFALLIVFLFLGRVTVFRVSYCIQSIFLAST